MEPECYGKMFPPVVTLVQNRTVQGKVFGYKVTAPGVMSTAQATVVNAEGWRRCVECPDFDACYRLSTATLLMELAVRI